MDAHVDAISVVALRRGDGGARLFDHSGTFWCQVPQVLIPSRRSCRFVPIDVRQPTSVHRGGGEFQELVHIKFRSEGFALQPSDLSDAVAMTRDLVRDTGGQMLIEQSGTGSVIHFFFIGHQQRITPRRQLPGASLDRVLVVDDDQLVADAVAAMLSSVGIGYDIVLSAAGVLDAIGRTNPDVVLLDVHLGDADGTVVFRDIVERWPGLPVVFSTGHASAVDLAGLVGDPLAGLLRKPYSRATLIETLRDVVEGAS